MQFVGCHWRSYDAPGSLAPRLITKTDSRSGLSPTCDLSKGVRMSGLVRLRRALLALVPAVLLTAPVFMAVASLSVPVSAPTVWVSDGTNVAAQVDTDTHAIARTETFPDGVRNLLVDPYDRSLWVLTATHVMHLSSSGALLSDTSLATYFLPGATDFKAVLNPYGGNLWVASGSTLLRLNPLGSPDVVTQLPATIKQLALGLDETLYVLTTTEWLTFSPNGQITWHQSLAALGFAKEKLDNLAVDTLGDVLWIAGPRVLARFDLATSALTTIRTAPTPQAQFVSPLALDAFTGTVWIADGSSVYAHNRQGAALAPINLAPLNIKKPRSLAYEHQSQTLWVGANGGLVAHFSNTGTLLGTLDAGDTGAAVFGVSPAYLLPTVKLQSPASGSVLTQPYTDINLTLGASCNSRACDLGDDYLESLILNFTLDGIAIPSSSWTITGSDAVYSPGALTEGEIVLDGTATDFLNHVSATLHDSFFIDLPPVITVTSPVDGSLTKNPQQTLLGFVNEPVMLTLNGDPLAAPPPTQRFTTILTLSEGLNSYTLIATDAAGSQTTYSFSLTLDSTPPEAPTAELGELTDGQITVSGTAEAGSTATVTNLRTNTSQTIASNGTYSVQLAAQAGDTIRITVTDAAGNVSEQTETTVPNGLPVINAPPVDPTVVSLISTTTEFLYTGSNPIQTGVAPGTIEPQRAAVLRGKVLARDNTPLTGVTITVHKHPEFGQTLTRADGMFDLAVNGGGQLTLDYVKDGFLPVQRQIDAPWQDFAFADDVVMIPLDSKVTTIASNATTMQVAHGNPQTDADGTRTATLLFPAGTTATMVLPDGSTQPLATLNVRATEYTVGDNGPNAMPAELPFNSGYTYAVELSADEALAAGAREITFNQPLYNYVDNFLNFPTGGIVPAGYYDREATVWKPSLNGRVIKVLGTANNLATLDTNGDNAADTPTQLAALGFTDAELTQLATLYPAGKTLWRVPVTHFTPWDHNWPYGLPTGAKSPQQPEPEPTVALNRDCDCKPGSIIEAQNQTLGETLPVAGTPFTLNYRSNRVPGSKGYALNIPLSGATIPSVLKRIDLEVIVAGRKFTQSFAAATNLSHRFEWDGLDAYGRPLQGTQPVRVRVGHVYGAVYRTPAQLTSSFAQAGGAPMTGSQSRYEITIWQESRRAVAVQDARRQGLGGWTPDVHHAYDPVARALHLGNGGQRLAQNVNAVISTVAGNGTSVLRDGGPATDAGLYTPSDVAFDAAGNLYIADSSHARIRKVTPAGIISTYAGNGTQGFGGDGGPATAAKLFVPTGVAVDDAGNVYVADTNNNRVRKIDTNGIISTVLICSGPSDVAVDKQGNLFVAERIGLQRILKRTPDGVVRALVDTDQNPVHVAVDGEGNLYYTLTYSPFVYKIAVSGGPATIVAGKGSGAVDPSVDGVPATTARISGGVSMAFDREGNLYIGERTQVRKIDMQGIIRTVAGTGTSGFSGDNGPARAARLGDPAGLDVAPDGALYITDSSNYRIRKVAPALPSLTMNELVIPSADGSELYVFTYHGRHLRTLNAKTGAVLYSFTYGADGLLSQITDGDGDVTRIERSGSVPTAILSQDGQRTALTLDANGWLATAANPATETHRMQYTVDGLLTRFEDPRENASTLQYDTDGRLTHDGNAAGGFWDLAISDVLTTTVNSRTVTMTSAEGRVERHLTENLISGEQRRTNTAADGTVSVSLLKTDGTTQTTSPDGTIATSVEGPDPRFGMQAPISKSATVKVPSGLTSSATTTRTATLANILDPLSLTAETTTTTVNGRAFVSTYAAATRQYTFTSSLNRSTTLRTDIQGRPVFTQIPGIEATNYGYDARGRLSTVTQGTGADLRSLTYTYGADGFVDTITDAQNRQTLYQRDAVGRITQATLPGSRTVGTDYDANSNVTGITPPNKPEHSFDYTAVDLAEQYTPPTVSGVAAPQTQYAYNRDKQLELLTRPDGVTLDYGYDTAGRLQTITSSANGDAVSYGYHAATGQLASIATPQHTLAYTYDGFLPRTETLTGTVSGTLSRGYDANFRTTQIGVNGSSITLGYDNDDLLTSAGSLTLGRHSQNGLLTGTTLGSATTTHTYNTFGELATFSAKYGATTLLSSTYTYDTLGRIKTKAESVQGVTSNYVYGYDLAGRLETVTKNGTPVESYGYDANGNRNGGTYDDQDRLLAYGNNTYTYTANGELDLKTNTTGTTNYNYDVYGNLKSVALPDGTQIAYLTDGRNRRIGKQVNGVTTQGFLYQDQLRIAAELDATNNVVSRFVYGTKINVPAYMVKSGTTYRIVTDHLGSVRLVVDTTTGQIAQRMDYDSYGNITNDTNPGFQPFGFAGGLYDRDTKLTRFGARDYDAEVGRWTTRDPIGFDGGDTNQYAYVGNDPLNRIDPAGLRDVIVAIWAARPAELSPGHVFVGEMNGTTITSQFPTPHGAAGANTTLTWIDTVKAEGREPDYVYQVSLPNDSALNAASAAARGAPKWRAFPNGSTSTHCANAAAHAMNAGGLSGLPTSPLLPSNLNWNLFMRSLLGTQVYQLPVAPW
ncbi:MAG: RHS repeat-associated core domain-containing protein [Pseudomonadota bacterium]